MSVQYPGSVSDPPLAWQVYIRENLQCEAS